MKRTHQEVDEILKDSKEYIRDYFMGKKEVEIPENFLRKSFERTAENINKYAPDLVNTKLFPDLENNVVKAEYFMGVDTYDKEMNAYCLTKRVDGITEVLLSKVIKDENSFEKEVENLAEYFNAKVLRSPS